MVSYLFRLLIQNRMIYLQMLKHSSIKTIIKS